jgi:hypothetical protein
MVRSRGRMMRNPRASNLRIVTSRCYSPVDVREAMRKFVVALNSGKAAHPSCLPLTKAESLSVAKRKAIL